VVWSGAINPVAIAIAPSDPNVVWLGMSDGTLYWTRDGFGSVEPAVSTGAPGLPISSVAINPENSSEVVVGYGPSGSGGATTNPVWVTKDSGATWSDITGDLPSLPVNSVLFDPSTSPASVIAANDTGVMYTTDASASTKWLRLGTGLPNAYVMQLAHDLSSVPQLLRVGTYGRSVFEMTGPVTDLQAGIRHDPDPFLGGDLTYHLFITNAGPEPAFGVVGELELDPALEFVSGAGCIPDSGGNVVACRIASLGASPEHGESVKIDLVAHLKGCPQDGALTSHWSVTSVLLSDTVPANNEIDDTATVVCFVLDTFIDSAVDGDGSDVPFLGKTSSTSIKFAFSGVGGAESFECRLDETLFIPCTSPATFDDLASGNHTFEVRAVGANGERDPTPATHVWSIA
jgi:hypothetical protein